MVLHVVERFPLSVPLCATNINKEMPGQGSQRSPAVPWSCWRPCSVRRRGLAIPAGCSAPWDDDTNPKPCAQGEERATAAPSQPQPHICHLLCFLQPGGITCLEVIWASPSKDNFVKLCWSNTNPSSACCETFLWSGLMAFSQHCSHLLAPQPAL